MCNFTNHDRSHGANERLHKTKQSSSREKLLCARAMMTLRPVPPASTLPSTQRAHESLRRECECHALKQRQTPHCDVPCCEARATARFKKPATQGDCKIMDSTHYISHVTRGWFAMTPQKQTYRELVPAKWQSEKTCQAIRNADGPPWRPCPARCGQPWLCSDNTLKRGLAAPATSV